MGQQIQKQQKAIEQEPDHHRRRLPLEMESEIFKFLKWPIQLKLIASIGRGIYGLFHQRLIVKAKRLLNSKGNHWVLTESKAKILFDRLKFMISDWRGIFPTESEWKYIFAKKGFVISEGCSRMDNFPGTIVYYFEVTQSTSNRSLYLGFLNGIIPPADQLCEGPEFYVFSNSLSCNHHRCHLAGDYHQFEWPNGSIKIKCNENGTVTIGCGILLNPENKLLIFYTANGILLGKPIPIRPLFDSLIPTVCMLPSYWVEANFGDNLAKKPFKFNINSLQLELDCHCLLSGKQHDFEWPTGCIEPKWDGQSDVYGCGFVLSPEDELSIFFTGNGILMGRQIPLNHYSGDTLYQTVGIFDVTLEANFGNNTAKPFKFDIHQCPGLIFN